MLPPISHFTPFYTPPLTQVGFSSLPTCVQVLILLSFLSHSLSTSPVFTINSILLDTHCLAIVTTIYFSSTFSNTSAQCVFSQLYKHSSPCLIAWTKLDLPFHPLALKVYIELLPMAFSWWNCWLNCVFKVSTVSASVPGNSVPQEKSLQFK